MKIFNTTIRTEPIVSEDILIETLTRLYPNKSLKDITKAVKETKLYKDVQKATTKSKTGESELKSNDRSIDNI